MRLRLRNAIFLSLLGLGLMPLVVHMGFHAPEVFTLLASSATRASLDHIASHAQAAAQHLTRRLETASMLAALPGPRELLGAEPPAGSRPLSPDEAAARLGGVVQRWLADADDVAEVVVAGADGRWRWRLVRTQGTKQFERVHSGGDHAYVTLMEALAPGRSAGWVGTGSVGRGTESAARRLLLYAVAPVAVGSGPALGVVGLALDPSRVLGSEGGVRWVLPDGRYLMPTGDDTAADDFPGLPTRLAVPEPFAMQDARRTETSWAPVVMRDGEAPVLWGEQPVDLAPVKSWLTSLKLTSLLTTLLLLATVGIVALVTARRLDGVRARLLDGVRRLVEGNGKAASFEWGGPLELRELGQELGRVAERYRQALESKRRAEAALIDEKERAQITLASIADAVLATNTDGVVEFANAQAVQLLGVDRREVVGRHVGEVVRLVEARTKLPLSRSAATPSSRSCAAAATPCRSSTAPRRFAIASAG